MKNKKKAPKTRVRSAAQRAPRKRRSAKARPAHKRILLHPITVMLLLCIGVLMAGLTYQAFGDSYTVTASVLAPIPPAATINSPADQTHFIANPVTVSGDCSNNTYVELEDNNNVVGIANCDSSQTTYSLPINLSLGSNVLVAQIFNITNNAGPPSSSVTLWLDNPSLPITPSTPATTPTDLTLTSQDSIPFNPNIIAHVSPYVTEQGVTVPFSLVTVTFHSAPIICRTYADANGYWSCTLDQLLPAGYHTVDITATTPSGKVLTLPSFKIYVTGRVAPLQSLVSPNAQPFLITTNYTYRVLDSGQSFSLPLIIKNGTGPYAVTVLWGDGNTSTIVRPGAGSFSASHVYKLTDAHQKLYQVKIEASDNIGESAMLQLPEIVRNNNFVLPVIGPVKTNTLLQELERLFWPAYTIVILMVFSFWLGERQEHENIFKHRLRRRRA